MSSRVFIFGYNTLGLKFADNDVLLVKEAFAYHGNEITTPQESSLQERKQTLISCLDDFVDSCSTSDTAIIYFSGHAFAPKGELLFLLDNNLETLNASTIGFNYLASALANCGAANKLLILDCCHALAEIEDWRPPQSEVFRILASSGKLEKAKEIASLQASFLAYTIHSILTDKRFSSASNSSNFTVNELYERVKTKALEYNLKDIEKVPLPKLIGNQGHNFTICTLSEEYPPSPFREYLEQLVSCFNNCFGGCHSQYPWCHIAAEIDRNLDKYVTPQIKYSKSNQEITLTTLDKYFNEWLNDSSETHLAILGDSGLGKSTSCAFLATRLAEDCLKKKEFGVIPIFLSLENLTRSHLLGSSLLTILKRQFDLEVSSDVINRLIQEKKFIFFLDGFDEISDRANHSRIVSSIRGLNPILHSGCKVVLTCRTHYFATQQQIDVVLRGESGTGTELYSLMRSDNSKFRVVELQEFSESEIVTLISKWHYNDSSRIWNTIKNIYNLQDLSKRPILLVLILQTLPKLILTDAEINRAVIYDSYTEYWINREIERIETDIDLAKKNRLIEDLALVMWKKETASIHYEELQNEFLSEYSKSDIDLHIKDYDTRNASFFNRDHNGFYKFMHKSFMEYYVAKKCVNDLSINEKDLDSWKLKWLDKEVASFVSEIIQQERYLPKIKALAGIGLISSERTLLWNVLHIMSLLPEHIFHACIQPHILDSLIQRAEEEREAVTLRQYCRIIAKFATKPKAELLIKRILEIVSLDEHQNTDNNETYLNYYYGQESACDALLNHLSSSLPGYDRELHIYVLGEIGKEQHGKKLVALARNWINEDHLRGVQLAIEKIGGRESLTLSMNAPE